MILFWRETEYEENPILDDYSVAFCAIKHAEMSVVVLDVRSSGVWHLEICLGCTSTDPSLR